MLQRALHCNVCASHNPQETWQGDSSDATVISCRSSCRCRWRRMRAIRHIHPCTALRLLCTQLLTVKLRIRARRLRCGARRYACVMRAAARRPMPVRNFCVWPGLQSTWRTRCQRWCACRRRTTCCHLSLTRVSFAICSGRLCMPSSSTRVMTASNAEL